MKEWTLYKIARKMLRQTNPYKKDVSEISYQLNGETISLLGIVEHKVSEDHEDVRGISKSNLLIAYDEISEAMEEYLYQFRSSFSFKQSVKAKFHFWLKTMQEKYKLGYIETPFEEEVQSNAQDTCIAMLKALHSREGVSEYDFPGIKPRSVRINLRKLSPNLYKGEKKNIQAEPEYVPFKIGGQPVTVDVKIMKRKNDRKQYYYTPNTIHPIVLQENLMQVGTLLQALCYSYYNGLESAIYVQIAVDIWSQLSDYAKEKIQTIYTVRNQDLQEFIEMLDDACPNDYTSTYHTEREMAEIEDLSIEDKLLFLAKLPERTATIKFKKKGVVSYISRTAVKYYGEKNVVVVDADGIEYNLEIEQIDEIFLD